MSESIAKVAAALVKAQKGFAPALKTSTNPHFKSKYADLSACVEAVIDSLNNAGIALVQKQHHSDNGVAIETIFVHESGEVLSAGILSVPAAKQDPQGYGSALTYARRYSLMAACGIAPEDDDGNAAKAPPKTALMTEAQVADWLASLSTAGVDELEDVLKNAYAAAEKHKDREAYSAFRAAAKKRHDQLTVAA